jgi:hypothetical protein
MADKKREQTFIEQTTKIRFNFNNDNLLLVMHKFHTFAVCYEQ